MWHDATGTAVPALTGSSWLTAWHLDPAMATLAVLAALAYLGAVRVVTRRGQTWPAGRSAWFLLGGLGALLLSTMSFLGAYGRVLLWPGAAENVLLLSLVPVALTLGHPVELWRTARGPRPPLPVVLRRIVVVLGLPVVGSLLAVGLMLAVYTTGYAEASLRHPVLLAALHVQLLVAGCLFYWPLLGVDSWTSGMSYPLRAALTFVDGLLDALPGLAVLGARGLVAGHYLGSVGRTWGPSLRTDQRIAGTVLVALGELVALPAVLVLLVQWARSDTRRAAELDLALDTREAARAAGLTDPLDVAAANLTRPWWETDPGPLGDRIRRDRD